MKERDDASGILPVRRPPRACRGAAIPRVVRISLTCNRAHSQVVEIFLADGGGRGNDAQVVKSPCGVGSCRMGDTRVRSFVSAQEVAELAGVSRSAVSRTFTDGASVSEATRRKVLQAAEQLGYHVNHLARSLIQEQSGIVCLIVAEIATPYQARMLDALSRRLQVIDRVAMVINTSGESGGVRGGAGPDAQLPGGRDDRALGHAAGGADHHLCQQRTARDPDQSGRSPRRADQRFGRRCPRRSRGAAHARPLRMPPHRGGLLDGGHAEPRRARARLRRGGGEPRARGVGGPHRPDRLCGGLRGGADPAQRVDAARCRLLRHRPARLRLHGRRTARVPASTYRPTSA